jgi:rod shape-determining protein MreD
MSSSIYLAVPLLWLLAVIQAAVLPHFPILGFEPQLLLLVALAWGALRGINEGMLWAFVAGFCQDLLSTMPMGLTPLAFLLAVLGAILGGQFLPTNRFFLPMLQAAVATAIFLLIRFLLLGLLGYGVNVTTAVAFAPLILLHGVLILPVYWIMSGLLNTVQPRSVQL